MVLELAAFVIYNGIKKFLTHVQRGAMAWEGEMGHFTKCTLKNSNTLYFVMKFIDIMI